MAKKQKTFLRQQQKNKSGFTFSVVHKVLPILILLVTLIISTQKCAHDLDYTEAYLGKPVIYIGGEPFYRPWTIILTIVLAASKVNLGLGDLIADDVNILLFGTFIAIVTYFVLVYVRNAFNKEDKNLMEQGEWGTTKELKDIGCMADTGVVIGQTIDAVTDATMEHGFKMITKKPGKLVMYDTNVNGMLIAMTRTGKGINTVISTHLLFMGENCMKLDSKTGKMVYHGGSVISMDPKGENYSITAGWRVKFSWVYRFSPVEKNTLFYNIMDDISEEFPYRDANMIANILVTPANPGSNADPHWQNTAQVLITAAILHCKCSAYRDKSLPGVFSFLTAKDFAGQKDPRRACLNSMITSRHCREDIHQTIVQGASEIANAADEELGSIFSSALEALAVFNDPIVAENCRKSDFSIDDFKYSDLPISWYICFPFSDMSRLSPLLRMIITFITMRFTQGSAQYGEETLRHRILVILDEFINFGKIPVLVNAASITAGYGVQYLFIVQSKKQLDELYGNDNPIMEHCRYIWTYAMADPTVADYFSRRVGNEGIIKQNVSNSGNRYDYGMNNMNISTDITHRAMITTTELETMPPDYELLLPQGAKPQLLKKVAYFSDPRMKDKVNLPKPETRAELLTQTVASRALRNGDPKWWENFVEDDDDSDLDYFPEERNTAQQVTTQASAEYDSLDAKQKEEIEALV